MVSISDRCTIGHEWVPRPSRIDDDDDNDDNYNKLLKQFTYDCFICSFFRESWCLAVFHDRFKDFRDEIRELLVAKPVSNRLCARR